MKLLQNCHNFGGQRANSKVTSDVRVMNGIKFDTYCADHIGQNLKLAATSVF